MNRYFAVDKTWDDKIEIREFDTAYEAQVFCELLDYTYVYVKDSETKEQEYQKRLKDATITLAADDYIKKRTKRIVGV